MKAVFAGQVMGTLIGVFAGLSFGWLLWGRVPHAAPVAYQLPTVLRVERLEIGPKQGTPSAVLGVTPGGAALVMRGDHAACQIQISSASDLPFEINSVPPNGKNRRGMSIYCGPQATFINLFDRNNKAVSEWASEYDNLSDATLINRSQFLK